MHRLLRFCSDHLLVLVTLSWLAGAVTAQRYAGIGLELPTPLVLLIILLLPATALLFPGNSRFLPTVPFCFLVGLLHTSHNLHLPSDPAHIARQIQSKTEATVVGRLLTMPEYNGKTTRCILDCEALFPQKDIKNAFRPIHGRLRLTIADELPPSWKAGDLLMARTTMDRLHRYQTPGSFNYPLQMATQGIYISAWSPSQAALEKILPAERQSGLTTTLHNLRYAPQQIRQSLARFLAKTLPPEQAGIYQALLTGTLVQIPARTLELFKEGGVFHLLAISGLHFSLLGLFASGILLFMLKRSLWLLQHSHVPTLAILLTAPILLLYGGIAGLNLPALRALITALLVLVAIVLRRQRSLLPLIAAAALLVLTLRPLALFTASFQLSFAAVLAINLIYPRLPVFTPPAPDSSRWRQGANRVIQISQTMLYVSLAATAGTLPILLYHFNRISLAGPLTNLLIEPLLCLWSLPWGLAAACMLPISPELAQGCLYLGSWGVDASIACLHALDVLPDVSWWTITPTFFEITVYYLLLWLLIARPAIPHRVALTSGVCAVLLSSFCFLPWQDKSSDTLRVDFLDVGQGTATLIRLPRGKTILLDGGGYQSERFDVGSSLIAPFLWHERIRSLDTIIITHPHGDHYNGLPFILSHFHSQELLVNGDNGQESAYIQLLDQARRQQISLRCLVAGDILYQDEHTLLRCLGTPGLPQSALWDTNDRSLVFHLQHDNQSVLLPADIGVNSERALLESGTSLKATVLLAPHHGSLGSSSEEFIQAVSPAWIVVSSGKNRWGTLPAAEHVERWLKEKKLLLTTAHDGTITLTSSPKALCARTFSGEARCLPEDTSEFSQQKRDLKASTKRSMLMY